MSKQYKGIVCRKFETNAQDMIIVLILSDGTKYSCLAKGIKSAKSKKASALELGNLLTINVVEGYAVPILTDVKIDQEFLWWKKDLASLFSLQLLLEIYQAVCYEDNDHPELFNILLKTLGIQTDSNDRLMYVISFTLLQILSELGTVPDLSHSVDSNLYLIDQPIYTISDGLGYVSEDSILKDQLVSSRIIKIQKFLLNSTISDIFKLQILPSEARTMLRLHIQWLEHIIEKELKSKKIVLTQFN